MNIGEIFSKVASGFAPKESSPPPMGSLPNGDQSALAKPGAAAAMGDAVLVQGVAGAQGTTQSATPLADFKDLWAPPVTGAQGIDPNTFQLLNADPAKVNEVASKINFTAGINPDLAKKALSGDLNAFLQVINGAAQQAFATATQASSALVDRQSSSAIDHMKKNLPDQFKKFSVKNDLQAENPQFSNPAVQPLLSSIQEQLAAKYPEASPAELKTYAKKYLSGVVEIFAPGSGAALSSQQATAGGEDENATFIQGLQKAQTASANFDWDSWASAQKSPSS